MQVKICISTRYSLTIRKSILKTKQHTRISRIITKLNKVIGNNVQPFLRH